MEESGSVPTNPASRCSGCGTAEPPVHELTEGVWACGRCLAETLRALESPPDGTAP
jgi:ribosomal protein L37AE/L43A